MARGGRCGNSPLRLAGALPAGWNARRAHARRDLGVRADTARRGNSAADGRGDRAEVRARTVAGAADGATGCDSAGAAFALGGALAKSSGMGSPNRRRRPSEDRDEGRRDEPRANRERPLVLIHLRAPANVGFAGLFSWPRPK